VPRRAPLGDELSSVASAAGDDDLTAHDHGNGGSSTGGAAVDGKEFFRHARSRLNYDQFSQFLELIKRLNSGAATRETTLAQARELFGRENEALNRGFIALISRHKGRK
jgi:hypothetical protein